MARKLYQPSERRKTETIPNDVLAPIHNLHRAVDGGGDMDFMLRDRSWTTTTITGPTAPTTAPTALSGRWYVSRSPPPASCFLNDGNVARHTMERLDSFVRAVAGKRLTYKALIA